MTTRRVPVVVLAGFLGSGKTTTLNHLLRRSRGTRIGAVVNDFGSIGIDAMTVAGQVDSMVALGDGCLCCAVDTSDLDEVLDKLARPSAEMDVIVVEASGLAEPETMIRMILAASSEHIVYGGLIEVVDAAEFEHTRERHPELERHVRAADLVVLNKADRVDDAARRALEQELERLSPGTPLVHASYGRIEPSLLFDPASRERPPVEQLSFDALLEESGEDEQDHTGHMHAAYESVEFTSDRALHPRRFLEFLDSRPKGLYRIKGFVDFGAADPANRYTVHAVGGFLRFTPSRWPRDEERLTQLVLIGSGIDGEAVRKELADCVEDGPGETDPQSLWGVLRYVDDGSGDDGSGDASDAEPDQPYEHTLD
ncbi:CobW family GTP-binding protein [Streptomyces albidus (ex Kaewkla and Franco 2022)]|uniref:CobW family GTP-binding protein n=1 Tax=Streptomyces albidus (ex Kaewkla and Franco 2022) TaxID=722709 RepID=UPI0015EF65BE|nr:GTP-binding protein [Streptomyces albidus (ex Kaewkla and Franco 2022)]